jgi:uncharacterized metal-binding protein
VQLVGVVGGVAVDKVDSFFRVFAIKGCGEFCGEGVVDVAEDYFRAGGCFRSVEM